MSWASADNSERFDTTHMSSGGVERIGSSRWYFKLRGYGNHEAMSNIWPPLNSPARVKMAEFAIANAALLGAEFEYSEDEEPGWSDRKWSIKNHKRAVGYHEDQGEAATAYLSFRGYWVCYNKQSEEWELASI